MKELCVLIHGFTGSPAEVEPLTEALVLSGYDVEVPVLHGHCGDKEELRKATLTTWLNSVQPILEKEISRRPVHLIGFSMGALLAAILASREKVASLTMLAPAVTYVRPKQVYHQIAAIIKASWDGTSIDRERLQARVNKITQTPIQSVRQFRRVIQVGKTILPNLTLPVCIIQGERDELVEPRGAEDVYNIVRSTHKEIHMLQGSGHLLCLDEETDLVNAFVLDFLSTVRTEVNA